MMMASQLLSPCITVLLEGLQGESQDEVRGASACRPRLEAYHVVSAVVETLSWLSDQETYAGCDVSTIGYMRLRLGSMRELPSAASSNQT